MVIRAPGLKKRPRTDGTTAYYWVAASANKEAGDFPTKTVRLHGDEDMILHRCRVLNAELKQWITERKRGKPPTANDTVKALIAVYVRTPESPYHQLKYNSRVMYDESLDVLEKHVGDRQLKNLTGLDFLRWYANFKQPAEHTEKEIARAAKTGEPLPVKPERMRRAYKAMQILRIIVKFGVVANVPECVRLNTVLEAMEFESPPPRTQRVTFEQTEAFCAKAAETGRLSMAIAQALQFELTLRQIDVIGEWEPCETGDGGIVDRGRRWSGGVLWSHINEVGVLEKTTTKQLARSEIHVAMHDTMAYPFLRKFLDMVPEDKRIGPIVKDEATGLPYRKRHFAETWREIARAVGIPDSVWNRDSRAGGVTEGSDAGADIEHLRHHATHSDVATTGRYNRRTVEKTRQVAELRVAFRGGKND